MLAITIMAIFIISVVIYLSASCSLILFFFLPDIDECSASKSLCAANATGCQNIVGSFTCSCKVGFSGRNCNGQ